MKNNSTTHFIGVGHGGRFLVQHFKEAGMEGSFSAILYPHTISGNIRLPEGILLVPFYPPSECVTRKEGEEVYRSADWHQVPEITPAIESIFRKNGRFVLLADFGDYTGVCLTEALIAWLYEEGIAFRVLALCPGVYNAGPFNDKASVVKNRLVAFSEFEWLNPRELPEVHPQMTLTDYEALAKAALLRTYREEAG